VGNLQKSNRGKKKRGKKITHPGSYLSKQPLGGGLMSKIQILGWGPGGGMIMERGKERPQRGEEKEWSKKKNFKRARYISPGSDTTSVGDSKDPGGKRRAVQCDGVEAQK